ncbi:MAG: helix-turn-helix transcriptional regulator, partial [Victivallales bacterium]|nr:helix-turn-helix transcriptional regulator [Victivallales bacterium]
MKKKDLMKITGLSSRVISKLNHNEKVDSNIILKICNALNCIPIDIVEIQYESNESKLFEVDEPFQLSLFQPNYDTLNKDHSKIKF